MDSSMTKHMKQIRAPLLAPGLVSCSATQAVVNRDSACLGLKPSTKKALVVFARSTQIGRYNNTRVYDGETLIGLVQGKTCFVYDAAPGKHIFAALGHEMPDWTNFSFLEADLLPGRTYYVYVKMYTKYTGSGFQFWVTMEPLKPGEKKWRDMEACLAGECGKIDMLERAFQVEKENARLFRKCRDKFYRQWRQRGDKARLKPEDGVI